MLRQYGAQRVRPSLPFVRVERKKRGKTIVEYLPDPADFNFRHRVGTIDIGTVVYIQDRVDRFNPPVFRNPWIVEAWLNRQYHPAVKGRPHTTYIKGGHLAQVKSLRDGRVRLVADRVLAACLEL